MPRILHISLCILFSTIILHQKIATLSAIIISVLWLFYILKNRIVIQQKYLIAFTVTFFSLYLISLLMHLQSRPHSFEVEKRVGLLLIIPFFTRGFISDSKIRTYCILFCLSVFIAESISIFHIVAWKLNHDALNLSVGHDVGKVLFIHRPYLGYFVLLSSVIVHLLIKKGASVKWFLVILFNLLFIGMIGARMALVLHLAYLLIILITNLSFLKKKQIVIIGIVLATIIGGSVYFQKQRFTNITENEPRFFIWEQAVEIFSENKNTAAYGFFDQVELQKVLDEKYKDEAINKGKYYWVHEDQLHWNTHNQYLDVFLSYGIIGLVLLLVILFYLIKYAWNTKNISSIFTAFSFILFLAIENVLARHSGVFIYSCIIPSILILSQYPSKNDVLSPNKK